MRAITNLVRQERPLAFFGVLACIFFAVAVVLGIPLVTTYIHTHKVPRFPTAFVVVGLMVLAVLVAISGVILNTVTRGRKESKMLSYLALDGPLERRAVRERAAVSTSHGPELYGMPQHGTS
jgi:hypothetical protein